MDQLRGHVAPLYLLSCFFTQDIDRVNLSIPFETPTLPCALCSGAYCGTEGIETLYRLIVPIQIPLAVLNNSFISGPLIIPKNLKPLGKGHARTRIDQPGRVF